MELPTENPSLIEVDPLIAATPRKQTNNDNYIVFLESNDRYELYSWTLDLYVLFFLKLTIY